MIAILQNRILIAGCVAWLLSQIAKTIVHLIINKRLVWERLLGDGGMPSSHSATVTGVAVTAGLQCGWDSPIFAVATILAEVPGLSESDGRLRATLLTGTATTRSVPAR